MGLDFHGGDVHNKEDSSKESALLCVRCASESMGRESPPVFLANDRGESGSRKRRDAAKWCTRAGTGRVDG